MFGGQQVTDQVTQSSSNRNFGLNQDARITKFAYNPLGGKGDTPLDVIDIEVLIKGDEKPMRVRFFDPTNSVYVAGVKYVKGDEEYNKNIEKTVKDFQAIIIHFLKSLQVTQETIDAATKNPVATFAQWAQIITALVPKNLSALPVDVFLHFQSKISGEEKRTYLEVPNQPYQLGFGKFIVPAEAGVFTEVRNADGLSYINAQGVFHSFVRSAKWLESKNASVQTSEAASNPVDMTTSAGTSNAVWN